MIDKKKSRRIKKRQRILNSNGGLCFYCNEAEAEHIDHFIPRCKGGNSEDENLRPSCAKCNFIKGSLDFDEFISKAVDKAFFHYSAHEYYNSILVTYSKRIEEENGETIH